jgi:cell division protein YceG involved in septum cleavage
MSSGYDPESAHPAGVECLYYVARNGGSAWHCFSWSYARFLSDMARAQH